MEDWLRDLTHSAVRVIAPGDSLASNVIYLAPPGLGVIVERQQAPPQAVSQRREAVNRD
jgi:chemotaxis response regulator CheB